MQTYLIDELKSTKIKKVGLGYFAIFMLMFVLVDSLNMGYQEMLSTYGLWLVLLNIVLSTLMALSTGLLMALSQIMIGIKGIEAKGSNMGILSIVFAILTYGCTPCVIALFANIGITFSVMVLPFAGLPYKFLTLGLIFLGIFWSYKDIMKGSCKI